MNSRSIWVAGLASLGLLLAWTRYQNRALQHDFATLRDEVRNLAAASAAPGTSAVAPGAGVSSAGQTELNDAIVAIRGEIAALRRELAQRGGPAAASRQAASGPATANPEAGPVPVTRQTLPPGFRSGFIGPEGLPSPVLATFQQQLGNLPIKGAHVKQTEEGLFFSTEARLADGRTMELAVDEAGNVRHRHLEMSFDALDPALQQVAAATLGELPIRRVAEVFENGQVRYRVQAKSPAGAHSLLLAPDGTLIQSQIERPQPKP